MGFFDQVFGTEAPQNAGRSAPYGGDAQAIERYCYMLQTAPPEAIEQAHEEAFAKLTPEQRRQVLEAVTAAAPAGERAAIAATPADDTKALARAATRAEVRQPGLMERTLSGGVGLGPSLFSSFAMGFMGSLVANTFFSSLGGFAGDRSDAAWDGHDGEGHYETADNTSDHIGDGGDFDV